MTGSLAVLFYRLCIDPRTLEPRAVVFFLLYYVISFFVAFIVLTTVLLCFEVYEFPYLREMIYARIGENVLLALESLLF